MAKSKFTHVGNVIGDGPKSIMYRDYTAKLREGKLHWISQQGSKFAKRSGYKVGDMYPHYHLDLESIKPIPVSPI